MLCCLSPSPEDFDATFNTLKYGGLARYILNCPAVNMAIQNSAPASSATLTPSSPHTMLRVGARMGMWYYWTLDEWFLGFVCLEFV